MNKTITYTEKRFFEWHEDCVSVTVRSSSGSYGGGSEVLVLQAFCDDDKARKSGNDNPNLEEIN